MNIENNKPAQLTPESQARLFAYTTAAGLGAFFAGQHAEAQVVASETLAPYPANLVKGAGTGAYLTYNYLDIDGDGTADFNLNVDTFRVNMDKAYAAQTNNLILNASTNGYIIPWANGQVLEGGAGSAPTYKKWLASSYFFQGSWWYFWNNFPSDEALGFQFTASDGQPHFGYMTLKVNHTIGMNNDYSATVSGIYYEARPNTGITIGALPPPEVTVTQISVGPANTVTIDFTSSDNADASTFTVETSPMLGAGASWALDPGAIISKSSPGVYQAVTTGSGGASQFFRIQH
jgi:hypothetical protein